jgi:hypothetical protein
MPPKPRQIRIEQRGALAAMEALQERSDEELQREQKFKAAALAILGARAAERYDADASRDYFRRAIAASRPQERMQLRRMADASPGSAPWYVKARGILLVIALVIVLLAIGFGIVKLVAIAFGGVSTGLALILGLVVIVAVLGALALFGRFRQGRARARAQQG